MGFKKNVLSTVALCNFFCHIEDADLSCYLFQIHKQAHMTPTDNCTVIYTCIFFRDFCILPLIFSSTDHTCGKPRVYCDTLHLKNKVFIQSVSLPLIVIKIKSVKTYNRTSEWSV